MSKKIFFTTAIILTLSFSLIGCGKEVEVPEVEQGQVELDKDHLKNMLIEYVNEDISSNSGFTITNYSGELNDDCITTINAYSHGTEIAYTYDPELNLDIYKRAIGTYWYDRDERLWYQDRTANGEYIQSKITDFIERLDSLTQIIEVCDDEVFNATNCYVLKSYIEGYENYTYYYITQDDYTLIGTKQENGIDPTYYSLISYKAEISLPKEAGTAETVDYNEYLMKKDGIYDIYQQLWGETESNTDEYEENSEEITTETETETTESEIENEEVVEENNKTTE